MAILHRISRLFAADFHGLLDSLEAPDVMLRHAIREMEESIVAKEQQLTQLKQCIADVNKSHAARKDSLEQCVDKIELCFTEQNEDLAKRFVQRRLETEKAISALAEQGVK